ncbi:hypothetical protein U27_04099 [Candidatus Vecturithrix granuli]|uniref:Uncharacterized protein n=1 Tax=Vecturithrix granuli TaxID=1499967 RepID=A0A081BXS9_VECG1|nr:hypothetical protein U27_04099 [Candidatus Vecturithrix granuli]
MAEIPDNINAALSDYVTRLSQEIQVRAAVLFGSCATGKMRKISSTKATTPFFTKS